MRLQIVKYPSGYYKARVYPPSGKRPTPRYVEAYGAATRLNKILHDARNIGDVRKIIKKWRNTHANN